MGEEELNELSLDNIDKVAGGAHAWKCPKCGCVYIGDVTYRCSNCGCENPYAPKSPFDNDDDGWGGQLKPINLEDLEGVAGGAIQQNDNGFQVVDPDGNEIGYYHTLEEAEFYASYICPRCKKIFSSNAEVANHILTWDNELKK